MLFGQKREKDKGQKIIVLENRELLNTISAEEGKYNNTNASIEIEKAMINTFLTHDRSIQFQLAQVYLNNCSISDALENIFSYMAISGKDHVKTLSNLEIVEYARTQALDATIDFHSKRFIGKYDPHYLLSQLDSIATYLNRMAQESRDKSAAQNYILKNDEMRSLKSFQPILYSLYHYSEITLQQLADYARSLYTKYSDNIDTFSFSEVYQLVIDSWEYIYEICPTYKLLMEMQKIQGAKKKQVDETERYALRKAVVSASRDWEYK